MSPPGKLSKTPPQSNFLSNTTTMLKYSLPTFGTTDITINNDTQLEIPAISTRKSTDNAKPALCATKKDAGQQDTRKVSANKPEST